MKLSIVRSHLLALSILFALPLSACDRGNDGGDDGNNDQGDAADENADDDADPEPDMGEPKVERSWYASCGDPVCSGYGGPWPDLPPCEDIQEGDPCDMAGATCDFMSDCNAVMVCSGQDPKQQEGGCPMSRRELKQDIVYTDAASLATYYRDLLDLRLATWRYRDRSDAKQSLGVILEDGEAEIWADPAHDRVDLYSYSSLAIAGVQVQAAELAELRAQMQAMQRELEQLRGLAERCNHK